ncbi:hypothetical protein AWF24_26370 [Escherichia coli]|nr:hypothetical protein AWF24_26370 [Escherichia coli]
MTETGGQPPVSFPVKDVAVLLFLLRRLTRRGINAACGQCPASGNGSGRPWNTAAVVFLTARLCRESGLKGVHQKRATGWRTLSPTPAGSGKSARPVPTGRGTLTTGSGYAAPRQPAQ